MPDITTLILDDHAWFRRQFAALDELQAAPTSDPRELTRLWKPLADRLDVHAIAEEKIFYPQLLEHGEDPKDETLDAIGDHNEIRDGVAQAARNPVGSKGWWDGVWAARRANDEHMGEEENEGLANFRLNATMGLRESLGAQFSEFMDAHPTPEDLDNRDKDPEDYVARNDPEADAPGTGLGIGSLKGEVVTVQNHLLRDKAPIPELAWKAVDDEARERLTPLLTGRRLADWNSTAGWQESSVDLGRSRRLDGPPPGVKVDGIKARLRQVQPLAEFRVPFVVSRDEIDDLQRGAQDPEFDDLARAAREAAIIENRAIFHGWPDAGIHGICEVSPYETLALGDVADNYPGIVARAVDTLRRNGIEGPYAMAVDPEGYTRIVETAEHGGYPLFEHLSRILGGQILRAPGLDGALVVSQRGGDFLLDVGQDLAIGYTHHDADSVHLYIEESFTFRVVEPDATVTLR